MSWEGGGASESTTRVVGEGGEVEVDILGEEMDSKGVGRGGGAGGGKVTFHMNKRWSFSQVEGILPRSRHGSRPKRIQRVLHPARETALT